MLPYKPCLSKHGQSINTNLVCSQKTSDVTYLDVAESTQRVKLAAAPGQRLPAFCTASGKAILAFLPEDKVNDLLAGSIARHTKNTLTSIDAILEDLRIERERGYATSEQEFEDGINAIAAPICNNPIGSVSIAGPAYRLTRERMMEIGPNLLSTVKKIAEEFKVTNNIK